MSLIHYKGNRTVFRIRIRRDGDPLSLTGQTIRAGLQSEKSTGAATAAFKSIALTVVSAVAGIATGTIPATGFGFTGAAVLRVTRRISTTGGTAIEFIGGPRPVKVVQREAGWKTYG